MTRPRSADDYDWTRDGTGRSNSSPTFLRLCEEVERLIRDDAHMLISGRADRTAGLIMAQLAHKHDVGPLRRARLHAQDVLIMAAVGGMPDTYWQTDSRILAACKTLGITPDEARVQAYDDAHQVDDEHVGEDEL